MVKIAFDYQEAFSRNIGWITTIEQAILRQKRVAIAGMGGVGGSHLLTLTRLGIGAFNIADYDIFELANFNRQAGASLSHTEKPKVNVLAEMALDINPDLRISCFPDGVTDENLSEFFIDVDVYVDGLDFFAFDIRSKIFAFCHEQGIPAITAAPLGMSSALLIFLPSEMTFEQYFCWENHSELEKGLRFIIGLAPARLHSDYLMDPNTLDLENKKGPSTPMGCELCAGVAASQALKILLNRGKVWSAPHGLQFDAYQNKVTHTWRPGGNNNPLNRFLLSTARRHFSFSPKPKPTSRKEMPKTIIEKIIDIARWAPSGDNTQPWRFEIKNEDHLVVHGHDTREHCVYDLHGHPSQIAIGALLENIEIGASEFGCKVKLERRLDAPETQPTFDIYFEAADKIQADPLSPYIPLRTVQRRSMQRRALTDKEKQQLEKVVAPDFSVFWLEGWKNKLKTALLMFKNAKIRLTMPEAYEVHKSVIEWNAQFSEDKIPDQAVGLGPVTTRIMEWTMKSWSRVQFFNTFLAGTVLPRIEMDFMPGINCAAHFLLLARKTPQTVDDYVDAGRAMQRFWLTATKLGLQLQPEMTPLIFSSYIREGINFTKVKKIEVLAQQVYSNLQRLIEKQQGHQAVFMGRIGHGPAADSRSIRLSVNQLRQYKNIVTS